MPEVFPSLSKVLLLDRNVVVQNDLTGLWDLDMKGKVIGAVDTCTSSEGFHRLDSLVDFSNPSIFNKLDPKAFAFAFGMNIFHLNEWCKQDLTTTYHKWFQLVGVNDLLINFERAQLLCEILLRLLVVYDTLFRFGLQFPGQKSEIMEGEACHWISSSSTTEHCLWTTGGIALEEMNLRVLLSFTAVGNSNPG
jgi:AraC-like DNA-binding protein